MHPLIRIAQLGCRPVNRTAFAVTRGGRRRRKGKKKPLANRRAGRPS